MVSALHSAARGLGSRRPGQRNACFSKTLLSHSASLLSSLEYKCALANCQGSLMKCREEHCDGLAFHRGGGW